MTETALFNKYTEDKIAYLETVIDKIECSEFKGINLGIIRELIDISLIMVEKYIHLDNRAEFTRRLTALKKKVEKDLH